MIKALLLIVGLALAGAAQAQVKCWTGADGKRGCGDLPPPGARLDAPKGAPATTDARKAPPAPAPQAQTQDKRAANREPPKPQPIGNPQDCERARETLRAMGGGGRSKRTDAVKARAAVANNCTS